MCLGFRLGWRLCFWLGWLNENAKQSSTYSIHREIFTLGIYEAHNLTSVKLFEKLAILMKIM